jgi:hypothetical protein
MLVSSRRRPRMALNEEDSSVVLLYMERRGVNLEGNADHYSTNHEVELPSKLPLNGELACLGLLL